MMSTANFMKVLSVRSKTYTIIHSPDIKGDRKNSQPVKYQHKVFCMHEKSVHKSTSIYTGEKKISFCMLRTPFTNPLTKTHLSIKQGLPGCVSWIHPLSYFQYLSLGILKKCNPVYYY